MENEFINVEEFTEVIINTIKEEGNSFADYYTNIDRERIMDFCEDEGYCLACELADDFRTYCNQEDTRICGNFNNVKWDYEREFNKSYADILVKLNNGINDKDTKEFKEWAIGWFFETFGTFGLKYNFSSTLDAYFEEEINEFNEETA